jgi:hypothetical protein
MPQFAAGDVLRLGLRDVRFFDRSGGVVPAVE